MPVEFDCCECRRHIFAVIGDRPPEPPLCAHCTFMPGWHEDPELVRILDPGYRERA